MPESLEEDAMKRMWEKTYTCVFSNAATAPERRTPVTLPTPTFAATDIPIDGLGEALPGLSSNSFVAKALLLIRLLYNINQTITDSDACPAPLFVNDKLNSKLRRQLQDTLAICGGSLPDWCLQIPAACRPIFTFATRQQLFHLTAFGTARAMQVRCEIMWFELMS